MVLSRLKEIGDWWKPDVITPEKVKKFIDMYPVYKNDVDNPAFKSQKEIKEIQNKNLRAQLDLCKQYSPYYSKLWKEKNIDVSKIKTVDDLEKLPLTTKMDYMKGTDAFRLQLGGVPGRQLFELIPWSVTMTTGTTSGFPTPFWNTTHDEYSVFQLLIRSSMISWGTPDDRIFDCFPFGPVPHIGYLRAITAPLAIGASVSAGHTGMPYPMFPVLRRMDDAIAIAQNHNSTIIMGIASYIRRMIMRAEELEVDFTNLRAIHALGEPCPKGMRDDMRRRVEGLGAENVFIHNGWGFTECQGSFSECTELAGNHNPDPSLYFIEIVDPETGERKEDGEDGVAAITHLNRRGTVLLRFVLGDIIRMTHETCPYCGRNTERVLPVSGSVYVTRTKELVKFKGTLINPGLLKDTIENVGGIAEYQIILTKSDPKDPYSTDKLVIKVAPTGTVPREKLGKKIQDAVQKSAEMSATIEWVSSPSEIYDPMVSLKATRVLDSRPPME
jgi:phenylacetate-coenzyme A ligase PaaK-like adenylate-forming protein